MAMLDEFFVRLGIKADTFTVRDFGKALLDLPLAAAGAIPAVTGMSLELGEMASQALRTATSLQIFTSMTGLNAQQLQRWQVVAKQVGIDQGAVTSSVEGITQMLAAVQMGQGAGYLQPLAWLGVQWRGKNAYQILQELMTPGEHNILKPAIEARALTGIGVNPELMRILNGITVPQFNRMAQTGVISAGQEKAFADLYRIFQQFELQIRQDFYPALMAAVPLIKQFAEFMTEIAKSLGTWLPIVEAWLSKNKWDPIKTGESIRKLILGTDKDSSFRDIFRQVLFPAYQYQGAGVHTLEYHGGDIHYNLNALNANERRHREEIERLMMKDRAMAVAMHANQGY
jgi:hypothetical protein